MIIELRKRRDRLWQVRVIHLLSLGGRCGDIAREARSYEVFNSTRPRSGRKEGIRNRVIQELKSNGKESALELFKQLNKIEYSGMYTEAMCEQWISDFQKSNER